MHALQSNATESSASACRVTCVRSWEAVLGSLQPRDLSCQCLVSSVWVWEWSLSPSHLWLKRRWKLPDKVLTLPGLEQGWGLLADSVGTSRLRAGLGIYPGFKRIFLSSSSD